MERIDVNNAIFQKWREYYESFQVEDDIRKEILDYVGNILSHKACVILDSEHLARLLNVENNS